MGRLSERRREPARVVHAGRFRLAPQDQADAPADVEDSHLMIPGPQRRGTAHDRKISFRDVRRPPVRSEPVLYELASPSSKNREMGL